MPKRSLARRALPALLVLLVLLALPATASAQPPPGRGGAAGRAGGPPPTPRTSAPFDISGTWVAIVTEDWRYRMVTPPKGNYLGVPLNGEGRKVADSWDPAKDAAAGEQCRAYGAAGLMRMPGRLRITWADDSTVRIEADAGTQTRTIKFGALPSLNANMLPAASGAPTWQGQSVAQWDLSSPGGRGVARTGALKVVTTGMRAGYLRKNGVPYSANAVLTEWFDSITAPNGDRWLVVMTEVTDPQYLTQPFVTTTHFKKEPDGSRFAPSACEA